MAKRTKRQIEASERLKGRILMYRESGVPQAEIGRRCRCSQQYVCKVLRAYQEKRA